MSKKLTPKEKHINRFIRKIIRDGLDPCSGSDWRAMIKKEERKYDRRKFRHVEDIRRPGRISGKIGRIAPKGFLLVKNTAAGAVGTEETLRRRKGGLKEIPRK